MGYPTGMPTVTVHYFAQLREERGRPQEEVELQGSESVMDLFARLFPQHTPSSLSVGFAVNQRHCSGSTLLSDGDEVAFIPPVGGG